KMSLKQQTVSGVAWSVVARFGQQSMQFIISILLARLLMPKDFGLVAMIMVFVNFLRLFLQEGFSPALVQKQDLRLIHIYSIFWLNIAVGISLTSIIIAGAPIISSFYKEPQIVLMTRVLAFDFFIMSTGIVPRALLQKKFAFKRLAQIEIATTFLSGGIAIVLAATGYGVWSLVFHCLCTSLFSAALRWIAAGWRPKFTFEIQAVRELFNYSINHWGFNIVNFWARNADNMLIGRVIGSAGLGIYNRAYSLMMLPISQISNVLGQVMFPVFSTIQKEPKRVKQIYLRAMGSISLVAFPIMVGLWVVTKPFILVIYGAKWAGVIPVLQVLCWVGLLQSLMNPTGWIYTSQGRTDWMFRWGVTASLTLIAGISVGVWLGTVKAVAVGYAVSNVLLFYPCIMIPGKLINMTFSDVVKAVAGPFVSAGIMAIGLEMLRTVFPSKWPEWAFLIIQVPLGAVLYVAMLHLFNFRAYREMLKLLSEQWQRRLTRKQALFAGGVSLRQYTKTYE
ncbi:MAG: MOP flippase family protein, partial [bacterium]